MFSSFITIVKGGGDIATAVAHKLFKVGFPVIITELQEPRMVRRAVSFGNCVYEKQWIVEGVTCTVAYDEKEIRRIIKEGKIPLVVDPNFKIIPKLKPTIIIDGKMLKQNCETTINEAPIVIGLGPGFTAREDVHAVIETQRGHNLGRVIFDGSAEPYTGVPGEIMGYSKERVLRAPCKGIIKNHLEIGSNVKKGDKICSVDDKIIISQLNGIIRGLIHDGLMVNEGEKIGDIDPRGMKDYCSTISEKGRNVAGGVLEAILILLKN